MSRNHQNPQESVENQGLGPISSRPLSEDSPQALHESNSTIPCRAQNPCSPLGEDDLRVLRRMVEEFKAQRVDFTSLPRRPKLRGPRVNTGISINSEIRLRALARAKADPDGTGGGNLSGLIELLLWMFLGCPEDVIDRLLEPGSSS